MNKKDVLEYLRTIALAMLAALVSVLLLLGYIQHQVYKEEASNHIQKEEAIDFAMLGVLIDKNLYLESQYPNNYKYNFKLGLLYEMKGDYKSAEYQFKQALTKVPFGEYKPYYRFALMYLRLDRLEDAEKLMDGISDQPDKQLIEYKAEFFNKLGDKYYNRADYENAGLEYQKALLYYNAINSDKIPQVKNSLASAYVYLADLKLDEMQVDDAISSLQMALSIVDAPILKYKLGLLLMTTNPDLSYEYFEEVFKREPGIINYETYTQFLSALATDAQNRGDLPLTKLYEFKIKKLKEYHKKNILSVEDVAVEIIKQKLTLNHWSKKYIITTELKLKNTSKHNIDSLYLQVVTSDENGIIEEYYKKIASNKEVLKLNSESPEIVLKSEKQQTLEDKSPKKILVEIYALKSEDSYKILLQSAILTEEVGKKPINKIEKKLATIVHKISSMLPAWLF